MAKHDDVLDLEALHREFQRSGGRVMLAVRRVGRHKIGDVADDEEFARSGIEYGLGRGA